MATLVLVSPPKPLSPPKSKQTQTQTQTQSSILKPVIESIKFQKKIAMSSVLGAGIALTTFVGPGPAAYASELLQLTEPPNALSLPTWAIHVSSVVEWIIAMALVWQYGEESGYESWKGLSWGMVPLLGGAFCACTWHFFYNSESLEVLVALQAALTVIGNATMCVAAFRIYKSSQGRSEKF